MLEITSAKNPRVKDAASLRDRREREATGRFLIDGQREIERAFISGIRILALFAESRDSLRIQLAADISSAGAETFILSPDAFTKVAFGQRESGWVAIAQIPQRSLADWKPSRKAMILVLDGLEKPGNLGAAARSADAAGAEAIIVTGSGTDLYNPNAVRASLGALFTLPCFTASAAETIEFLREHEIAPFAARVEASRPYTKCDYRGPCAFILGSEAEGLSEAWHHPLITPISLPMLGRVDSLNVSVTAAVLLYEAVRQRETHST